MNKNSQLIVIVFSIIALMLLGVGINRVFFTPTNTTPPAPIASTTPTVSEVTSPTEATYTIEGNKVTLVHGVSVTDAAPGSATKITTRYFGNEVVHDLNGDGRPDTAFIVTQDTGGSGVFYYAVAALNTPRGYVGSQGYLLGDRIAPQATTMDEGTTTKGTKRQNVIVFNFADRRPDESFTTPPSVGKSVWLKLDPTTMQFGVVEKGLQVNKKPPVTWAGWHYFSTTSNELSGYRNPSFSSSPNSTVHQRAC